MMKTTLRLSCALMLLLCAACTQKDLDINTSSIACGDFKISHVNIMYFKEPTCTGMPLHAYCALGLQWEGDVNCVKRVVFEPATRIQDSLGQAIPGMIYPSVLETSIPGNVGIDTAGKIMVFHFDFTFPSVDAGFSFSDAFIQFHCENEDGVSSNSLRVRIYGLCASPYFAGLPSHNVTLHSSQDKVKVKIVMGDDDADDYPSEGLSIRLNDTWVLRDHLLHRAETHEWPLLRNQMNELVVQGRSLEALDDYCTLIFNGTHSVKCNLNPEQAQVIHVFLR